MIGFDRTYEELKHVIRRRKKSGLNYGFDRTYEELKPQQANNLFGMKGVLIVPMRN